MDRYITGMEFDEWAALLTKDGKPSNTRALAMMRWIHRGDGAKLPEVIPDGLPGVSKRVLRPIHQQLNMPSIEKLREEESEDGTVKILSNMQSTPIETVMIPTDRRTTVCVSSQSGCARGCGFCATAKMGIIRNLKAGEIVAQVLMANQYAPPGNPVRNVVFMGMGEPMDNLEEVLRAIRVLTVPGGLGLSPKRITVSSVGVVPKMAEFIERSKARLAISLNATTNAQRSASMPVNDKWPIETIVDFIGQYGTPDDPILVEYILMAGFNDTPADLERLITYMRGKHVRVNLIPLNPHFGSPYDKPTEAEVYRFHRSMVDAGIATFVRTTRGDEIRAACGQLQRQGEGRGKYRRADLVDASL